MSAPELGVAALAAELTARGLATEIINDADVVLAGVTDDSRRAAPGVAFVARVGATTDGHAHAAAAVASGASAVVAERALELDVPVIVCADSSRALGECAAIFAGEPSRSLQVIGVTGTNGKTSIVTMLDAIVASSGRSARSIGTLTNALTTPGAVAFQAALADAMNAETDVVAAEVSSHALDQNRVAGTRFAVAVFTNLTQDHLDYHADMPDYFAAKARLFAPQYTSLAVIDVSDSWGVELADLAEKRGLEVRRVDGDATRDSARCTMDGSSFMWRGAEVTIPLSGSFNVVNATLAAEAAVAIGLEANDVATSLALLPQVPGRFEWIREGQDFGVVVDYSHTPASVEVAISSARELTDGRVIVVFGAAGDRDPGKRPLMAAAAERADVVIVTSDNPRSEDPASIIDDVLDGFTTPGGDPGQVQVHVDRRVAIEVAIDLAATGDIVVIAGKGHEDYQIIGDVRHDFDDRIEARAALASRAGSGRLDR